MLPSLPSAKSVIMLAKAGAPDGDIFGVEPLPLIILGDEVFVALMGKKLDVKTMDLTGDQRATVELSWNIDEHSTPQPDTFQILTVYTSAWY